MSGSRARLSSTIRRAVDGTLESPDKDTDGGGSLIPRFDFQYMSSQYSNVVNVPSSEVPAYGLVNFRLMYRDPKDVWESAFEITNLADRYYPLVVQDNTLAGQGQLPDYISWVPGPPREYSFSVKRKF